VLSAQHMPSVAVAYSGGRDSTALLHAVACALRDANKASSQSACEVVALHVHHGLSDHADGWLVHAHATCQAWAHEGLPVRLLWRRVHVPLTPGLSVEAEARVVRYAALKQMAAEVGAEMLLLAHHRRDQAETLLLQALRGGSVAALAAMPREDLRDGLLWVRPWLEHPREAIDAYIKQHGLSYIDDDSNDDPRFARNRFRLQVWPALRAAFPQAEASLAASALRLADALVPLRQWQADLVAALRVPGDDLAMDVPRWATWSAAARRQSLRQWYAAVSGRPMSASWTVRLAQELPRMQADVMGIRNGEWPELGLYLYRGRLRWQACGWEAETKAPTGQDPVTLSIDGPGEWPMPAWGGVLRVTPCVQGGVAPVDVQRVKVVQRSGGERFQAGPGRPRRTLKKQFQMLGVPAWRRDVPLFWAGDKLLFVPGLGLDAGVVAPSGARQWALSWHWLDAEVPAALKCEV
jgi:tRNA(Ile)-lysidine synthase